MKYANEIGYSDRRAYEVVRVVSDKTIEVRRLHVTRDPSWKPEFIAGGFSAHCVNQSEQRYDYASDADNPVIRIRLNKRGVWNHKGVKFVLSDAPSEFYDYNF